MTDANDHVPTPLTELDAVEARVLGCLVEKASLTPDVYPLTLNAIVTACNQKTSREPVMDLEPGAVGHCLRRLEDKKVVRVQHSSRALRYEHRMDEHYTITPRQRAVLCTLMLRGPQTLAEIHTRSERLAAFHNLEDVRDTIERLMHRQPAMVVRLPRAPGQREERFAHLLCGAIDTSAMPVAVESSSASEGHVPLAERVSRLEQELAELRDLLMAMQDRPSDT